MIRNAVAMARFAETTATVVGDLAQNTRLSLVALSKGEGIATKALMPQARAGASEGSISFLHLDDPALIVAKASRELKDFGGQLWRAGTATGDRHPLSGQLFDNASKLTRAYAPLDSRGVQFSMGRTPSLGLNSDRSAFTPLVDKASMLDNLVPPELVRLRAPSDYQMAFSQKPWMEYVVKGSFDAEIQSKRLLGFTQTAVGRSRIPIFVPVHAAI